MALSNGRPKFVLLLLPQKTGPNSAIHGVRECALRQSIWAHSCYQGVRRTSCTENKHEEHNSIMSRKGFMPILFGQRLSL